MLQYCEILAQKLRCIRKYGLFYVGSLLLDRNFANFRVNTGGVVKGAARYVIFGPVDAGEPALALLPAAAGAKDMEYLGVFFSGDDEGDGDGLGLFSFLSVLVGLLLISVLFPLRDLIL